MYTYEEPRLTWFLVMKGVVLNNILEGNGGDAIDPMVSKMVAQKVVDGLYSVTGILPFGNV